MFRSSIGLLVLSCGLSTLSCAAPAAQVVAPVPILVPAAPVNVLTNRNDGSRTGLNALETVLKTTNVNSSNFGKLYSYLVDGSVYAQPLFVSNVAIPGQGTHNVLYVVTMNDTVYAFDAAQNLTLWSVNFTNASAGVTAIPISDITGSNDLNIVGSVGIAGTPVIDATTQTMYLVARTKEVSGSTASYVQRLHALDITTGAEKFGGPVVVTASVPGIGEESVGGMVPFDSFWENQRPALAEANGQVIIAWSSHEDDQPYHGWVIAYNATTLAQTGAYCDTANGYQGGIWMAGRGPAVDSNGNLFYMTGNGSNSATDFSESVIKLSTKNSKLAFVDYFQTDNYSDLNNADEDLGSSGPLLIPGANAVVGGGKQGLFYVLNPAKLGHYVPGDTQIPQEFQAVNNAIFPGPAYFKSASLGQIVYLWTLSDVLKGYKFVSGKFVTTPVVQSTVLSAGGYDPGAVLSVSSNGTVDSSAIVWASLPTQDADHGLATGLIRAINATTGAELWNSTINLNDAPTPFHAKFVPPTIANGRLYVATFTDYAQQNYVHAYGLLPLSNNFTLTASPASSGVLPGGSATFTISVKPVTGFGFGGNITFTAAGLPTGATASFNPTIVTGASSTVMTISTTAATPLGTSTITVTGKSSKGVTSKVTITLTVTNTIGAISANFLGNGAALNASDVAGVAPKANWNNLTGYNNQTPQSLSDEFGTATSATITWAGDNGWQLSVPPNSPDWTMMNGYLDDGAANPTTLTVSGLTGAANGYLVYVYANGDSNGSTRNANYTLSGSGTTTQTIALSDAPGNVFSGTFSQVTAANAIGNYMVFTVTGTSFTLVGTPTSSTDALRAPINGIQIIPQ